MRAKQDPAFHAALQADALSLFAREALAAAAAFAPEDPRARAEIARLRQWDGRMDANHPEPLVFSAWMREIVRRALESAAGDMAGELLRERPRVALDVLAGRSAWCGEAGCGRLSEEALVAAIDWIAARHGRDPAKWRWGAEHRAPFDNPLYARIPVLGAWLSPDVATNGDYYTVNRGAGRLADEARPFAHTHGAGFRAVYDLADLDASLFAAAPGQSGDPLSGHWDDMAGFWAEGRMLRFARSRVELGTDAPRLHLLPP
jgi:penicillin amidase